MNSSTKFTPTAFGLSIRTADLGIVFLLAVAVLINLKYALAFFSNPLLPDAVNSYLPYAQSLLSDKLGFFLDPRSLRTVPMTYIYPALFGANPEYIKVANVVLSCLIVLIMFRLGSLLHSRTAGILAALFYASSPLLADLKPAVLSEPPYFFFTALWLMSVAEITEGRKNFIPVAGIACGLMILTRGTYIYFLYATLAISLVMSLKGSRQTLGRHLFAAHAIAFAFPLAVIIKNWVVFDYPNIAAGTGAALYFGSHPLTGGYEAPYYGLGYDIGAVVQGLDHLSIEGDKLLTSVGVFVLKQQTFSEIFSLYFQKAFAFLFSTKAVLADTIWNHRSLRIIEVVLTLIGLLHVRKPILRWFMGGALLYQVLVHIPLLYNPRYSIGAIEIPLLLLAGVGLAGILADWDAKHRPALKTFSVFAILFVAVGAGELHRKYSQVLMPDILSVPHVQVDQWDKNQLAGLTGNGLISEGNGSYRTTEKHWTLDLPIRDLKLAGSDEFYVYSVNMGVQTQDFWKTCGQGLTNFKTQEQPAFDEAKYRHFRINSNGNAHYYHFSASYGLSHLFPGKAGVLRIGGKCPRNSRIQLNSIALSMSRAGLVYRNDYLLQAK